MKKAAAAVLYGEGALAAAAAAAAGEQLKEAGRGAVTRRALKQLGQDGADAARRLRQEGVESVFVFGAGGVEGALVSEAAALGWTPHLFLLGVTDGRDLLATAPAAFKDRIFLAFPTLPSDVSPAFGEAATGEGRKWAGVSDRTLVGTLLDGTGSDSDRPRAAHGGCR